MINKIFYLLFITNINSLTVSDVYTRIEEKNSKTIVLYTSGDLYVFGEKKIRHFFPTQKWH